MLRLTPDGAKSEILAHGFRNPYDFDFRGDGEIFTYDSDVERDIFLPWYTPTRLFHVAPGGHHGWRLKGFQRSWPRPGYDPGTVDVLADLGRGSPTGVVCYRHRQFPRRFRDGLFVLDWTFGKVYFVTLRPEGASYRAGVEVFLEPSGSSGQRRTDAVVAPDGSLFVSIGGRKTRGSVYRIEYVGKASEEEPRRGRRSDEVGAVLRAPQPPSTPGRGSSVDARSRRRSGVSRLSTAIADRADRPRGGEGPRGRVVVTETVLAASIAGLRTVAGGDGRRPRPPTGRLVAGRGRGANCERTPGPPSSRRPWDPRTRLAALDAWVGTDLDEITTPAPQCSSLLVKRRNPGAPRQAGAPVGGPARPARSAGVPWDPVGRFPSASGPQAVY